MKINKEIYIELKRSRNSRLEEVYVSCGDEKIAIDNNDKNIIALRLLPKYNLVDFKKGCFIISQRNFSEFQKEIHNKNLEQLHNLYEA